MEDNDGKSSRPRSRIPAVFGAVRSFFLGSSRRGVDDGGEVSEESLRLENEKKEVEKQKKQKEHADKLAAIIAETEALKENHIAKLKKDDEEQSKREQKRLANLKELEESRLSEKRKRDEERAAEEKKLEAEHVQKLEKMSADAEAEIKVLEMEIEDRKRKTKERLRKVEEEQVINLEESLKKQEDFKLREQKLREELQKAKESQEQSFLDWKADLEAQIQQANYAFKDEIEKRKKEDMDQINEQKRIKEEEEKEALGLIQSLKNLKEVVALKSQEMRTHNKAGCQTEVFETEVNMEVDSNKLCGLACVIIPELSKTPTFAVMGLPKTGRSTLVGALAGGIWPKNLNSNPVETSSGHLYKLNYPNNGFVHGSINENRAIYEDFFKNSRLHLLSALLVTIDGNLREEDFLVLTLAEQYGIQTAIIRTKLDEWLDNRPKNQTKEEYVENDKNFIMESLHKLDLNFSKNKIYNVSALAMIVIAEDGIQSEMAEYQQDENNIQEFLNHCDSKMGFASDQKDSVDMVVTGLKGSGKTTIIDGLRKTGFINEKAVTEFWYDESMSAHNVIKEITETAAKMYLIVVPNTVGNIDAKLVQKLVHADKKFAFILNKSDEIMDNLKKQKTFVSKEDYIQQRKEAAKVDFDLIGLDSLDIPMFVISGLVLMSHLTDEAEETEEQKFTEFLANLF